MASHLPPSSSPTLHLTHPTPAEKLHLWTLNGQIWRRALSADAYLAREHHLAAQPLTRDGGIAYWVLVDAAEATAAADGSSDAPAPTRTILASCETLRKRALVARGGQVEESVAWGIGSVFCREEFRGRGYAGRMMRELGEVLRGFEGGARFTVLYSDIGKKFYAKNGWKPFPSSHVSLPPVGERGNGINGLDNGLKVKLLRADDLRKLCDFDDELLRRKMTATTASGPAIRVALTGIYDWIQWHHAREEFVANELVQKSPEIKGAMVELADGKKVWCIWTRMFGSAKDGNTMYVLRLVMEGHDGYHAAPTEGYTNGFHESESSTQAAVAVLRAAQREAAKWNMRAVELWNPSETVLAVAKEILPAAEVINRDEHSITSLMWYPEGSETVDEVEWVANEKYAWC